jgi:hypothetical protein
MAVDPSRNDRWLRFLADAMCDDPKQLDRLLKADGVNVSASIRKNVAFVEKLQKKTRLRAASAERLESESMLASLREQVRRQMASVSDPLAALKTLFASDPELAIQFRKLDTITAEDALQMLEEEQLLKMLEDLDDQSGTDAREG